MLIRKIVGVATVGSLMAFMGLLHRFLTSLTDIILLVVVSGFLMCALIGNTFTLVYFYLVYAGLEPFVAGMVVVGIAFFMTITILVFILLRLRHLQNTLNNSPLRTMTKLPDMGALLAAFVDGFLHKGA